MDVKHAQANTGQRPKVQTKGEGHTRFVLPSEPTVFVVYTGLVMMIGFKLAKVGCAILLLFQRMPRSHKLLNSVQVL